MIVANLVRRVVRVHCLAYQCRVGVDAVEQAGEREDDDVAVTMDLPFLDGLEKRNSDERAISNVKAWLARDACLDSDSHLRLRLPVPLSLWLRWLWPRERERESARTAPTLARLVLSSLGKVEALLPVGSLCCAARPCCVQLTKIRRAPKLST